MNINDSNINTKIYVVEERVNNHEIRIKDLESEVGRIDRLDAILEAQVDINRQQMAQMDNMNKSFEKTFQAINQNLTKLNIVTERLKEDLDKTSAQSEAKLEEVRIKFESEFEKGKVSVNDLGVKIFYGLITIIPSIVLAWILAKSGLK